MNLSNNCFLGHLCLLVTVGGVLSSAANETIALPGCESQCGELRIPYPFGIGKKCYASPWFEIECNKTSNTWVPFLKKIGREVMNISFGNVFVLNTIRIRAGPILSSGCSGGNKTNTSSLNLTNSPFLLNSIDAAEARLLNSIDGVDVKLNSIVAVGCNAKVSSLNTESIDSGCRSSCDETKHHLPVSNKSCNGYRCCQVTYTQEQWFEAKLDVRDPSLNQEECSYAFLTDDDWSPANVTEAKVPTKEFMPVTLSWYQTVTAEHKNNHSFKCSNRTLRDGTNHTACACKGTLRYGANTSVFIDAGYRGNPYIEDGCKDINECQKAAAVGLDICWMGTYCVNIPGGYHCKRKRWVGIILGFSVGVGIILAVVGVWRLCKLVKKRKKIRQKKRNFKRNGGLLLRQQLHSAGGEVRKTKIYSLKEIQKATNNFDCSRILGQGGQGTVFKGMLSDGTIVAIKKSKLVDEENLEEFINETIILSQIDHRNIVKLLGCCLEAEVPILVYEYILNGNLFQHLHDRYEDFPLTWSVRMRIAVEVAQAVYYLHSMANSPIYHRDIKSTNILLDEKYRAKVSDFGTSRSITIDQTHLTTLISGTVGYIDPEYFQSSQFTEKSDVYSFGVVLVELLTGERPVSNLRSEEARILSTYFISSMEGRKLFEILDKRILEEYQHEEAISVAKLAKRCLSFQAKKRPNMKQIVMELHGLRSVKDNLKDQDVIMNHSKHQFEDSLYAGFFSSSTRSTPALDASTSSLSTTGDVLSFTTF